jgi:hypothetical protein
MKLMIISVTSRTEMRCILLSIREKLDVANEVEGIQSIPGPKVT